MASSLDRARAKIQAQLESDKGGVFTEAQLRSLFMEYRGKWGLADSVSSAKFLAFLVEKIGLRSD